MKLYDVEEASILVSDGTISSETAAGSDRVAAGGDVETRPLGRRHDHPAAGAADNLTTTAQDTYGNTTTSYSGAKSLTFSGASASPAGPCRRSRTPLAPTSPSAAPTSIDFSEGVASRLRRRKTA